MKYLCSGCLIFSCCFGEKKDLLAYYTLWLRIEEEIHTKIVVGEGVSFRTCSVCGDELIDWERGLSGELGGRRKL